jgi:hypothetical protein
MGRCGLSPSGAFSGTPITIMELSGTLAQTIAAGDLIFL